MANKNNINIRIAYTSIVYFRRLFSTTSFAEIHPYLAVPTCFYLAGKIEEMALPVSRALSLFEGVCKSHKIEPLTWTTEEVFSCESVLLYRMNYSLLLQHPYRPLRLILSTLHCEEYLQSCLNIVNDCYYTSIPLLYPPHLIAFTSVYMICTYNSVDPKEAFETMGINMDSLKVICSKICAFYSMGADLWPPSMSDIILSLSTPVQ
ncbi:hypothetical protein WA538_002710 [Blastocystis sp. DL]